MKKTFFVITKPTREGFKELNMSESEKEIMALHFNYLKNLEAKKLLYLAGPAGIPDSPFGVYIFFAENKEKARELIAGDPSVEKKVQRIDLIEEIRLSIAPPQVN